MSYFPDITPAVRVIKWVLMIAIPLAIWKALDIVEWMWTHVHVGISWTAS